MATTSSGSKKSSKSSRKPGKQGAKSPEPRPPIQFGPDHDFRSQWKVCENACLTHEDAAAFSNTLRAAFPRLRFLSEDHWKPFVDWDYWRAEIEAWRRRDPEGLEIEPIRHRMRDPSGEAPRFWDHLGVAEETAFFGWVIPEGWTPEWGEADKYGVQRIMNPPRLALFFRRAEFRCPDRWAQREQVRFRDPPAPRDDDETLELDGSQLTIRYNRYDEEAEAFAKTVFRILYKQVVDRFITIEPESRRALTPVPERNRRFGVAGRRAEAWALERRHNYLMVPNTVKPVSYPFAPGDVMSTEEYVTLKAKWAAELDEAVAAEERKDKALAEKSRREAEGN